MEIPLSLYLHLPWCKTKCPYCDFNSHQLQDDPNLLQANYAAALKRELSLRLPLAAGRKIHSIYFGGGTPNLFPPEWFATTLEWLQQELELTSNCEITLEANPGEGRVHDYLGYYQAGINRVSLGVQSFNHETLTQLGRDYLPDMAIEAIESLRDSPIKRFNLDLIFAAPKQTLAKLEQDIDTLLTFAPTHLSCYELTIEPNTFFYSNPPAKLPDDDRKREMFDLVEKRLTSAGLQRYEVSSYATVGEECRHNLNYWKFGDYLALGAGAHAKLSDTTAQKFMRYANQRNPYLYSSLIDFVSPQVQHPSEHFFQFCVNSFRLVHGFSLSQSAARLFIEPSDLVNKLSHHIDKEFLQFTDDWVTLNRQAWLQQNHFLSTIV